MQKPIRFRLAFLSVTAMALCAASARGQDLRQDTLAVRILLDQNGLTSTPVAQVAEIDPSQARVSALRLSGRSLASLPPQIGALDALRYLVLSDNLLDSLPAELWGLGNLVELDLGGNRIASLDPRVGRLRSLLFLGLRGNGLPALPDSIFDLPHLETLLLADNALDTLPEDVAGLAFLKYLDVSGNALRTLPFTLAIMDSLDSLDVSGNLLDSLPEGLTQLRAAPVHLGKNRLCELDAALTAWANARDPAWRSTQDCGNPVRPRARTARGPSLRAWSEAGLIRLDWSRASAAVPRVVSLRDAAGREVFRREVGPEAAGLVLPRASGGFLWAELREGARVAAETAVAP